MVTPGCDVVVHELPSQRSLTSQCNDVHQVATLDCKLGSRCKILLLLQVTIDFPIIADPTREISVKYGMLDPGHKDKEGLPLTCRAVFIVGARHCIKTLHQCAAIAAHPFKQ